jgi:[protein-PII] uridylyltransferase
MRMYFRHARSIERAAAQALEEVAPRKRVLRRPGMTAARRLSALHAEANDFEIQDECLVLRPAPSRGDDPAHDPEVMLEVFASVAHTGCHLSRETEQRLEQALPLLSAHLEDGPGLWRWLERILTGAYAGHALRAMHAMGILELVMPEFHGIDALVIRDAYHRYTVDEHTFVLIDTMHGLLTPALATGSDPSGLEALGPEASRLEASGLRAWGGRFATILRDLPHPGLLFLAALLHDTGKGHSMTAHAAESVRMAENVVTRLELDAYERDLVLGLIRNHLEMSSALRRDVFEAETVRTFAARVPNPEALRMLTVFTYADISAVHPDALTPWKAENLHHLYVATAHFLDRNVDDERIGTVGESAVEERMHRVLALLPEKQAELQRFLAGFPQRYLLTRTPEEIRRHFAMAQQMEEGSSAGEASHAGTSASGLTEREVQLDFHFTPESSELTLVSRDRPMLFANMAGVLAAWGMNIVSANAFSNADGIVVDRFRFTDGFRTLELNVSERSRFVESIREALVGTTAVETMLAARQRSRRKTPKMQVKTHVGFDDGASTRSTVLEVIAQDTPGLLRALTLSLAAQGCNIEVALVDTEGEMAIDVFYVTRNGAKLEKEFEELLGRVLAQGVEANAS